MPERPAYGGIRMEKKQQGKAPNPNSGAAPKKELKVKKDPHAEALKKASEEVVAKAIHDMLMKGK